MFRNKQSTKEPVLDLQQQTLKYGESSQAPTAQSLAIPLFDPQLPELDSRTFELESILLREEDGLFLPCTNGRFCRGMVDWRLIPGLTGPVLLASSMSQRTLDQIQWEEYTPEMCVLCHRYTSVTRIMQSRRRYHLEHKPNQIDLIDPSRPLQAVRVQPIQTYINPRNVSNGYRSDWMIHPNPDDAFFYPVVDCPLNVLFAKRVVARKGERPIWIINQQALKYIEMPFMEPEVGERIKDFMNRIEHSDGINHVKYSHDKHSHIVRQTLHFKCLQKPWTDSWLAWSFAPDAKPIINESGVIDLEQLTKVVNKDLQGDQTMSDEYHFRACQLWDAFTFGLFDPTVVVSDTTFDPKWHQTITELSYFTPLSKITDNLLHQISKSALKQRCQTRNAQDMITKHMVTRVITEENVYEYDASLFVMCKDMLLCSLLGNYPNRSRGLTAAQRYDFIRFFKDDKSRRWIMNLFIECPLILNACIRDFVSYNWSFRPALRVVIADLVNPEEYCSTNETLIERLRVIFIEHYKASWERVPPEPCAMSRLWTCGWKDCGIPCTHVLMNPKEIKLMRQRHNNKRRRTRLIEMNDVMSGLNEVVADLLNPRFDEDVEWTRPLEYKQFNEDRQNEENKGWAWGSEQIHDELNKLEGSTRQLVYRRPFLESREIFRANRKISPNQKLTGDLIVDFDANHLSALNDLLQKKRRFRRVYRLFNDFSTRKINLQQAKRIWSKTIRESTKQKIVNLDSLVRTLQARPFVLPLSRQLAEKQFQAIHNAHDQQVDALHCCLVYCPRCSRICTPFTDRQHGLRHVKVSFIDRSLCCDECESPLAWIDLLGKLFVANKSWYGFCSSCGFLSKMNNDSMRQDLLCDLCTPMKRPQLELEWKHRARKGCCAITTCRRRHSNESNRKPMTELSALFMHSEKPTWTLLGDQPIDVFLCIKHYHQSMNQLVKQLPNIDAATIEEALNEQWTRLKRRRMS